MAIAASLGLASPGSGVWAQIQREQAQRNADQAERQARVLQGEALRAQSVADRAQEDASSLRIESSEARLGADNAERQVVELLSLRATQEAIGLLEGQVANVVAVPLVIQPMGEVVGFSEQRMGALVDVIA